MAASCLKHSIPGDFNRFTAEEVQALVEAEDRVASSANSPPLSSLLPTRKAEAIIGIIAAGHPYNAVPNADRSARPGSVRVCFCSATLPARQNPPQAKPPGSSSRLRRVPVRQPSRVAPPTPEGAEDWKDTKNRRRFHSRLRERSHCAGDRHR